MKENKFRVYHKKKKKFIYFDLEDLRNYDPNTDDKFKDLYTSLVEEVNMYTDIKVKNSNDIWEGDIMYVAGIGLMEVIYYLGGFVLADKDGIYRFEEDFEDDIEDVRGNIYQNPELMKGNRFGDL